MQNLGDFTLRLTLEEASDDLNYAERVVKMERSVLDMSFQQAQEIFDGENTLGGDCSKNEEG